METVGTADYQNSVHLFSVTSAAAVMAKNCVWSLNYPMGQKLFVHLTVMPQAAAIKEVCDLCRDKWQN